MMTSLFVFLGIACAGFGVASWHHAARFVKRKHPLSVTAAMSPLCGALACWSSLNDRDWERVVILAFCLVASIGTATTVVLTRLTERRLRALERRAK